MCECTRHFDEPFREAPLAIKPVSYYIRHNDDFTLPLHYYQLVARRLPTQPPPYSLSVEKMKLDWVGESANKINACNAKGKPPAVS
jgi:hypothetical protein